MRAGRRTQVVKGAVCKTAMQRFDPARRLHTTLHARSVRFIWSIRLEFRSTKYTKRTKQTRATSPFSRCTRHGLWRWRTFFFILLGAISQSRNFSQFPPSF
jgi:hypothetical protein